jgi:hypothetical protein
LLCLALAQSAAAQTITTTDIQRLQDHVRGEQRRVADERRHSCAAAEFR